jgi:hypothetical protein
MGLRATSTAQGGTTPGGVGRWFLALARASAARPANFHRGSASKTRLGSGAPFPETHRREAGTPISGRPVARPASIVGECPEGRSRPAKGSNRYSSRAHRLANPLTKRSPESLADSLSVRRPSISSMCVVVTTETVEVPVAASWCPDARKRAPSPNPDGTWARKGGAGPLIRRPVIRSRPGTTRVPRSTPSPAAQFFVASQYLRRLSLGS